MARIRSIHPGWFSDEAVMTASPFARIFMIGLWTECFDDGCFEWKPVVLKARIFPADAVSGEEMLNELERLNVVRRFTVGERTYGVVRNFGKYQRPKKPNSSGVMTAEMFEYSGISSEPEADEAPENRNASPTGSVPVPHQFPTGREIRPQMEDGGCRMEDGKQLVGSRADADAPPAPKRGSSKSETRGHRLPADWSPDPADAERLGWDAAVVAEEAVKFEDYYRAAPGERGRKLDWHATFRNWMRKALEDRARLAARRPSSQAQAPPNGSSQAFVGSSSSDIALRVKSYQRLAEQCEARGDQHGARNWQFKADQARMAMQ